MTDQLQYSLQEVEAYELYKHNLPLSSIFSSDRTLQVDNRAVYPVDNLVTPVTQGCAYTKLTIITSQFTSSRTCGFENVG